MSIATDILIGGTVSITSVAVSLELDAGSLNTILTVVGVLVFLLFGRAQYERYKAALEVGRLTTADPGVKSEASTPEGRLFEATNKKLDRLLEGQIEDRAERAEMKQQIADLRISMARNEQRSDRLEALLMRQGLDRG